MKYNRAPTKRYGNTIKYRIPEFKPSASEALPLSTTALHIAHCALAICAKINSDIYNNFFINNMVKSLGKQ